MQHNELVELSKIKLKEYPKYAVTGDHIAQVVKVYDGDTITITMRTSPNAPYYQYSVRMYGYDSPELRPSSDTPDREKIVGAAQDARNYLKSLILGKPVLIKVLPDDDKYGRLLGNIYACPNIEDLINAGKGVTHEDFTLYVNKTMMDQGHGYEYYGGTKK